MSEHNPNHGRDAHDPDYGKVESSAMSPKPVLLFLAVLFVATAFVFFVVKGLDWTFKKLELETASQGQPATQIQSGRQLPPEPLLQGAPGKDDKPTDLPLDAMENLRKETDAKLNSYGWVDKPGEIAHIPINRAKDIIADKGLPSLPSPTISEEVQKAEMVRKEVLDAVSSAGRMIKTQGQSQESVQQQQQIQRQVPPQQH
ncbi:MAG: hypothetical protein J2P52_03125 [Blastocatellia bacterium]|nr:hypothetical protein [Blastocatellia bacterium]